MSYTYSQGREVAGIVTSAEDNQPVIGASVRLKDRQTDGTSSDTNGKFFLKNLRTSDKTLVISYIGMKTQEVDIKPNMTIVLEVESEMLDEVIAIAFGTAKKSAFTGSATVINADDIVKRPVSNIAQALSGQVAGLQTTITSGQPGASPTIILRGIGSINAGTSPLIILDGIPYEGGMSKLNPSDIESITVLKDAASSALYGSRGANGVIMITSKGGKVGSAKVNVDVKWGAQTRARIDYDYIKSPSEYYETHYKALYNYNIDKRKYSPEKAHIESNKNMVGTEKATGGLSYNVYSYPDNEYLIGADGRINPNATLGRVVGDRYLYPDNWVDELYKTSLRQEYNVSASGGNAQSSIYGSFGYLKDEGIVIGSAFERYNVRLRTSYQLKSWLKFGGNAMYTKGITDYVLEESSNSSFSAALGVAPIFPVYLRDKDGNMMHDANGKRYDYGTLKEGSPFDRPVILNNAPHQTGQLDTNRSDDNVFTADGFIDISLMKDLKLTLNAGTTVNGSRQTYAYNPFYGLGTELNGQVHIYHTRRNTFNFQQLLSYNKSINNLHNFSLLLGHEHFKRKIVRLDARKTNMFNYWGNQELNGAISATPNMGSYASNYNTEGYFFRTLYDYDNKYFFALSYRRDASSIFHPDNRWGDFYSIGGSYLINKEDWFNVSWIDFLKLKFSMGQQGNDNIGSYRYVDTYKIQNSNDELSLSFFNKGNKAISWETNTNINTGVEFELFKRKLTGELVYYYKKTGDMLYWFIVPPALGYPGYFANIGDMVNKGIEIDLRYTPVRTKDINWTINLNMAHNKNKITYMADARKIEEVDGVSGYASGSKYVGEGIPFSTWRIRSYAGVSENGLSMWYKKNKETGELTTTETYTDADYFLRGNPHPDLFGGFGTSLYFHGFDFSMMFNYSIGGKVYDSGYVSLMSTPTSGSVGGSIHKDVHKAWTPENPNSNIPRWQFDDLNVTGISDRFLTNASFLSLQNIQIGYSIPSKLIKPLGVSKLRVFLLCDNVYYWTKRKGFDPRFLLEAKSSSTGLNSSEAAATSYSPVRSFVGGISLEF